MNSLVAVVALMLAIAVLMALAFFIGWRRDADRSEEVAGDGGRLRTQTAPGTGTGSSSSYDNMPGHG